MPPAILIVDDEPTLASALALFLDDEGFRVRTAPNGAIALDAHIAAPVDLILSDLMMPVVDGLGLVEELQRRGDTTPVVLMSAAGTRAVSPPGIPLIRKPFELDDVVTVIQHGLNGGADVS